MARSRSLSDSLMRTVRMAGPTPPRVTFIRDGIKHKPGCEPARVCPAGNKLVRKPSMATLI